MKRHLLLLSLFFLMIFVTYKIESKRQAQYHLLLNNHVKFSGKIISFDASNNHLFGVIRIKVESSNRKQFRQDVKGGVFPYQLQEGYAELYSYVPTDIIKIGQSIMVDSDQELARIFEGNKLIGQTDVFIGTDGINKSYIQRHSSLFK